MEMFTKSSSNIEDKRPPHFPLIPICELFHQVQAARRVLRGKADVDDDDLMFMYVDILVGEFRNVNKQKATFNCCDKSLVTRHIFHQVYYIECRKLY